MLLRLAFSPSQFQRPPTSSSCSLLVSFKLQRLALSSGFILCCLSLQVPWSSSHTKWNGDGSAGLWLAGLKHLCLVGVVWLWSVTATLENKPSIPAAERSWNPPVQRPQSTTLTHAMLVRCQIRGTRTQYTLTPISALWRLFCNPTRSRTFQWGKKKTTKAWFVFVFSLVKH